MKAKHTNEKINPFKVLEMIAADPGLRAFEYVIWLMSWFSASERAIKDILGVLIKAGCLTAVGDDGRDRRARRYQLTERGRRILGHPRGAALLHHARQLFSTCRPRRDGDRDLASLQARFERAEAFSLGARPPVRPLWRFESLLPVPEPLAAPEHKLIHESRCKVCRSPYRREIDLRLAAGHSQSEVREHFNAIVGDGYFTANNISCHLRKHLNEHDPRLRELLETRLALEDQQRRDKYEALQVIVNEELGALLSGVTEAKPRDMIKAVRAMEKLGEHESDYTQVLEETVWEFGIFIEVIKKVTTPDVYDNVLRHYSELRAKETRYDAYEKRRQLLLADFTLV